MPILSRRLILFSVLLVTLLVCGPYLFKESYKYYFNTHYTTNKNSVAKILILWRNGVGERETIERLKIAGKRLNFDIKVASTDRTRFVYKFIRTPVQQAIELFKPDFILTLEEWVEYQPGVPNYLAMTLGIERYITINAEGQTHFTNPEFKKFDAILPTFTAIDKLKMAYEAEGKKFNGFNWHCFVYKTDYSSAQPKKLLYSGGSLWDQTRSSRKYLGYFAKLDKTGYFLVSGFKDRWKHTPNSRIGLVPFDGKSLINKIHEAGISLILHTEEHIKSGAPTARIFEAVAANAVIISDKHPFLVENFGDNILYIDIDQDAEGMFQQTDKHVKWILSHPEEAKRMANNCHKIFLEKYTLEEQMTKLVEMHRKIIKSGKLASNPT